MFFTFIKFLFLIFLSLTIYFFHEGVKLNREKDKPSLELSPLIKMGIGFLTISVIFLGASVYEFIEDYAIYKQANN